MPKTVGELLRETGLSDEQIAAIDAKAMEGMTRVVTSANETLEKAEFAQRAQREEYDQRIAPALATWADRDTTVSTENAAMKAWIQKVKDSGYVPAELFAALPGGGTPAAAAASTGARGPNGQFVAGKNEVPGSPGYVDLKRELSNELATAYSFAVDTNWKYEQLYGAKMPDSPTALIREAAQNRMSPMEWAAKKYDFAGKEKSVSEAKAKAHDDSIRQETRAAVEKEWAEKTGNNPMVRTPVESEFAKVSKAVESGKRQDPLKMTPEQRKVNTHANIQKEFSERSSTVQ